MAICPKGHDSANDDFCDTCGLRIAGRPSPGSTEGTRSVASGGYADSGSPSGRPAPGPPPVMGTPSAATGAAGAGEPCPRCGTPRVGQFCETCGYKFGAGQPPWPVAQSAPAPAPNL